MLIESIIGRLTAYPKLFDEKIDIGSPPYRAFEPYKGYTWNDMLQVFSMLKSEMSYSIHKNGDMTFTYEKPDHSLITVDIGDRIIMETSGEYKMSALYNGTDADLTINVYDKNDRAVYKRITKVCTSYECWEFPSTDDNRMATKIEVIYHTPVSEGTPYMVQVTCNEHIRGFEGIIREFKKSEGARPIPTKYFINDNRGNHIVEVICDKVNCDNDDIFRWFDGSGVVRKEVSIPSVKWFDADGNQIMPGKLERFTNKFALGRTRAEKSIALNRSGIFQDWVWYYADTMWNSINKIPPVSEPSEPDEQNNKE